MKKISYILLLSLLSAACSSPEKEAVDYVNPYIGNISHLLVPTFPTVHLPNSMLRVFPERADYTSEYLSGLPAIVTGHRGRSGLYFSVSCDQSPSPLGKLSYDNEHITPYSFSLDLEGGDIHAEFAVSRQSALYEFSFSNGEGSVLLTSKGEVKADGNVLTAWQGAGRNGTKVYVYAQFQETPSGSEEFQEEGRSWAVLHFKEPKVHVRYAVSFISLEQAAENLAREQKAYDVKALACEGRRIWNEALGRIAVKGGTEDQKTVFYTSYYRTLERPVCISEGGRYWSAYDGKVHDDEGTPAYADDWLWDTYRAAHPLRILLDQEIEEDILASYIRIGIQSGNYWAPNFPGIGGDGRAMNCNHTIASYADAMVKGLKVDTLAMLRSGKTALLEKTLVPWRGNPAVGLDKFYWENGFFPALKDGEKESESIVDSWEKRQGVAVTLGTSYDCWCLEQIALAAGDDETADYFHRASLFYRNLYNPETAFFHPKDSDGNFIEPFDYDFPGGPGAREYYDENNGWVYRWDVQHDIPGLIELMGGDENFIRNLDQTFATPLKQSKNDFYAKMPDHTGNVGQFSMANEPSLHIPYLYNYAGAPWKTQKRVRQMLRTWFRNDLMGVPGDEDGGGMTSFVVFSSIGFYPVTPGKPEYAIGSPIFTESRIRLSNGKTFTVKAPFASEDNKYIVSASLNGKALEKPFISHSDIMEGGTLLLEMSSKPKK